MPGGKTKGNRWESDAAKALSIWYGRDFKRVPASGALRWGEISWTYGDVLPPSGLHVVFEAKHWKDVSIDQLLGTSRTPSGQGQIVNWWEGQTLEDAARASADLGRHVEPFLLWKMDYTPARLCMRWPFFTLLSPKIPFFTVCYDPLKPGFVCVNFREFLEDTDPQDFREAVDSAEHNLEVRVTKRRNWTRHTSPQ